MTLNPIERKGKVIKVYPSSFVDVFSSRFEWKIGFRCEKFQKLGVIWRQNVNFSEKMGALGDSTQFCEQIWGLWWDCKKIWSLWAKAMLKLGVLTALHMYHLRIRSAPSRGTTRKADVRLLTTPLRPPWPPMHPRAICRGPMIQKVVLSIVWPKICFYKPRYCIIDAPEPTLNPWRSLVAASTTSAWSTRHWLKGRQGCRFLCCPINYRSSPSFELALEAIEVVEVSRDVLFDLEFIEHCALNT